MRPGEGEQVEADLATRGPHHPPALDHLLEAVAGGAVIGAEDGVGEGDGADPHRVAPRLDEAVERPGTAAVGVDVDGRRGVPGPDPPGGLLESGGPGERLALAALAEGDDAGVGAAEMVRGEVGELGGGGGVAHPRLRGGHRVGLERDAAQAVGVAGGRGRQRPLVAAVEGVLGGVAVVLERADGELVDHPVAGEGTARRRHRGTEVAAPEALGGPPLQAIGPRRRHHQPAAVLGDRGVAEEGQTRHPRLGLGGGQQGAQVADGKHRGDGEAVEDHPPPPLVETQRPAAGQVGDGRRGGQGDELLGVEGQQPTPRAPRGTGLDGPQRAVGSCHARTHDQDGRDR